MISTDREIQNLKPGKRVFWVAVKSPHGGGLCVRVISSGIKTWHYRFRFKGKQDSVILGRYPATSLREARELHGKVFKQLRDGFNPKTLDREQTQLNSSIWTMNELFEQWLKIYERRPTGRGRPPSETVLKETHWRWQSYLAESLGDLLVTSITRQKISLLLTNLSHDRSREQARKCLTLIRQMLNHAQLHGHIDENPAIQLRPTMVGSGPSRPRERFLKAHELRRLLGELEKARLSHSVACALRMIVLTGQRRTETVLTRWSEIDFDKRLWVIPEANSKSFRWHHVWLSDAAIQTLKSVHTFGEFVFESDTRKESPVGADSLTTALKRLQGRKTRQFDSSAPLSDLPSFSVHDLRRSMATGVAEEFGTAPHVIEKMLNHESENKLVKTYQRAEYRNEMAEAWAQWGNLLTS